MVVVSTIWSGRSAISFSAVDRIGIFEAMDKMSTLEYINQMFPTEASLSGVEPLMQKIQSEIRRVDAGILAAVRQQSNSGTKAKEDLAAATHAVEELTYKIREIKTKAEQSEMMVQEICRDIKKLDFAKKHITTTITALHRLTMLVSAVEQLQIMASKRQYKEAAAQLEAVNQLCSHFEAYRDIPKITELREKFKNIKQILKSHVFSDFSSLGTGKESEETNLLQYLSDACLVVDALEPSVREELVNNFCSRELTSYEQIFEGAELAKLDKTERRYAWIKRRMRTNEEIWKIFPTSWLVPYRLCIQFSKKTRKQLEGILDNMKEKPDVATLLMSAFCMKVCQMQRCMEQMVLLAGFGVHIPTVYLESVRNLIFSFEWNWKTSLLLEEFFSDTDFVSVVALLKEHGASKKLSIIIEGESLMNGGTTIVIY
ncbi:hypothetical protein V6N13_097635 [Hibiscus sabdariffa]